MGTYRKEWDCCGSVTETNAWEPDECPFCATPPSPSTAPTEQDQANVLPPFAAPASQHDADLHDIIEFALSLSEKKDARSAIGFLSAWNWETDDYVRAQWPEFAEFELASRGRAQGGNTSAESVEPSTAPTVEVDERKLDEAINALELSARIFEGEFTDFRLKQVQKAIRTLKRMRDGALASKPAAGEADTEKLKQAALAATPGPWHWWTSNSTLRLTGADQRDGGVLHAYVHSGYGDIACSTANQEFIAAANPSAVLKLVAEVERLRAAASSSAAREAVRQSIDTPANVLIDTVNMMLWLYRRLPRAYERPPFVEKSIADLANIVGIEVSEYFTERCAAPAAGNTEKPKEDP